MSRLFYALLMLIFSSFALAQTNDFKVLENVKDESYGEVSPDYPLTADVVYNLLSADIAYQRGYWKYAYDANMAMAQKTGDSRLSQRAMEIAMVAEQPRYAENALDLWRKLAPESEKAALFYLGFAMTKGNFSEAQSTISGIMAKSNAEQRGALILALQQIILRMPDQEAGYELLKNVTAPYNNMPETHIALAQASFARKDLDGVRREANTALDLNPKEERAVLILAQTAQSQEEALKIFSDYLDKYPDAKKVRVEYARALVMQKDYKKAQEEFETLLEADPDDAFILYSLGVLYLETGETEKGEEHLTRYANIAREKRYSNEYLSRVQIVLSEIAEKRNDDAGAVKWLNQVEANPQNNRNYLYSRMRLADFAAKNRNYDEVSKIFANAETFKESERISLLLAEAQLLRKVEENARAYKLLENEIKKYPKETALLYDFALTAEKMGKYSLMEKNLRKVISLNPKDAHAYNALGYSFAERNIRLKEAYSLISKANELSPQDTYIMDSMGWIEFRRKNFSEAESWLRRAYETKKESEIAAHLGEVLWVRGNREEAKNIWREAWKIDKSNDVLKKTLKRFNVGF